MIELNQRVIVEMLNMRTAAKNASKYRWATVTKVGRKYFELSILRDTKFNIEGLRQVTVYTPDYRIHLSAQNLYEEVTASIARRELQSLFNTYSIHAHTLTPGQLMSACAALGLQEQVHAALTPKINQLQEDLSDDNE